MRASTTIFEGEDSLPEWMATFARQLRSGGRDAPPDSLPPLLILDELRVTAEGVMAGRARIPKADRASLQDDVTQSLVTLGRSQREAADPQLRAFEKDDLRHIAGFLSDVEGARRLVVSTTALAERLTEDPIAVGAWDDAVAAFECGERTDLCEIRLAQLRSIVERRGHDWEERERLLMGLLGDDLYAAVRAGAVDPADAPTQLTGRERAGLPLAARLESCRRTIVEPAREADVHVWFAFDRARVDDFMRKRPVQFFNSRLWPDAIGDRPLFNAQDFDRPDELDDDFASLHLRNVPERDGVLARVSLPRGPIAGSRARAEHLLIGIVRSALPDSGWRMLEGAAAYSSETGWWGSMGFREPSSSDRSLDPEFDGTAERIQRLDDRYVEALARGDATAEDALSELRWDLAAQNADPVQRLALRIRTLERALPTPEELRGRLPVVVARHLQLSWSRDRFERQIVDLAYAIQSFRTKDQEAARRLTAIHREVVSFKATVIETSLLAMVRNAEEVSRLLPAETVQGRLAAELTDDLASGAATLDRLSRYDKMFDRLIARSVRQRNAIIHGGPTVDEVVASCQAFVEQLTGFVIATAIDSAGDGSSVASRFERSRSSCLTDRHRLGKGSSYLELLEERQRAQ